MAKANADRTRATQEEEIAQEELSEKDAPEVRAKMGLKDAFGMSWELFVGSQD